MIKVAAGILILGGVGFGLLLLSEPRTASGLAASQDVATKTTHVAPPPMEHNRQESWRDRKSAGASSSVDDLLSGFGMETGEGQAAHGIVRDEPYPFGAPGLAADRPTGRRVATQTGGSTSGAVPPYKRPWAKQVFQAD